MATLAAITGKGPSTALSTYRDQQFKGSIHQQVGRKMAVQLRSPTVVTGGKWLSISHSLTSTITTFRFGLPRQERQLTLSTTLYVGNLSFYTTEEQVSESIQDPVSFSTQRLAVWASDFWSSCHFSCTSCSAKLVTSNASSWVWTKWRRRPADFAFSSTTRGKMPKIVWGID